MISTPKRHFTIFCDLSRFSGRFLCNISNDVVLVRRKLVLLLRLQCSKKFGFKPLILRNGKERYFDRRIGGWVVLGWAGLLLCGVFTSRRLRSPPFWHFEALYLSHWNSRTVGYEESSRPWVRDDCYFVVTGWWMRRGFVFAWGW